MLLDLVRDEAGPRIAGAPSPGQGLKCVEADEEVIVLHAARQVRTGFPDPFGGGLDRLGEGEQVGAPMHGRVVAPFVRPGDRVEKGQWLAVPEAMKLEHIMVAPDAGQVAALAAELDAQVAEGARFIVLNVEEGDG